MKKIIPLLFFFGSFFSYSQDQEVDDCGTEINDSNVSRLTTLNSQWLKARKKVVARTTSTRSTKFIPVQIHIIREDAGTGGVSAVATTNAFNLLNEHYITANIHFYQCGAIKYIDNSTYYNYNKSQVNALYNAYKVDNVLNLFIANTVTNTSGGSICGHAYFPGSIDFVMQSASCIQNGSTLAHEVGHYFGLYHTHETSLGSEAVNGTDCATQGDLMCDTPADPKLSKSSNVNRAGCIYYGKDTDENGSAYSPSVINIMSYSAKECRYNFTEEQKAKMHWVAENKRAYLTCATPPLAVNFYYGEEESCATSKMFSFYNASKGAVTNYDWDFGDGIGTSSLESPNYSYSQNGIYTVRLVVSDGLSTDTLNRIVAVGAVGVPYSNDFEGGKASLNAFVVDYSMKNNARVHTAAAKNGTYGLVFDGTDVFSTTPFFQTPTASTAFDSLWNPHYKSKVKLCVDATNTTNLTLEFDKKQLRTSNDNYTNFRVSVNGVTQGHVYQVNNSNSDDPAFTHITIDLSAYDGQLIRIGFEGTHKYHKNRNSTNGGCATFIDNIKITGDNIILPVADINHTLGYSTVYPNPAKNTITLKATHSELESFSIFNGLGEDVTSKLVVYPVSDEEVVVDLTPLSQGIYYINTKTMIHKITKQ